MKRALTAAAALISLSLAGAAGATPSLSYATPQADIAGAEFVDVKFKFKKFGHSSNSTRMICVGWIREIARRTAQEKSRGKYATVTSGNLSRATA